MTTELATYQGSALSPARLEVFWSLVDKSEGCWNWIGGKTGAGYGAFRVGKKTIGAHRLSWELANKAAFPDDRLCCHHCDNPACVNPAHIYAGTSLDNSRDAVARNRTPTGVRHGSHTHSEAWKRGDDHWMRKNRARYAGEKNHNAKLTEMDVAIIRSEYKPRVVSLASLGKRFGVTPQTIHHIIKGRKWNKQPAV